MIISLTGFDGVGKSTSVEIVRELICKQYNLVGISAKDVNNNSLIYNSQKDLDRIFNQLNNFDVISCPFYFRTSEYQKLQTEIMNADKSIFENANLIVRVANLAKKNADEWFSHVIKKLLDKNKIIICDRYYYDEIAYRSLYNLNREYIEKLYNNFIEADVRIFLYADFEFILNRNCSREDAKMALFQRKDKMSELLLNLDYICKKYKMVTIDIRDKSKECIANEICKIIKPKLLQSLGLF